MHEMRSQILALHIDASLGCFDDIFSLYSYDSYLCRGVSGDEAATPFTVDECATPRLTHTHMYTQMQLHRISVIRSANDAYFLTCIYYLFTNSFNSNVKKKSHFLL